MKLRNPEKLFNSDVLDFSNEKHKTVIHPPTFPSVVAAYAYFTRHEDQFHDDFQEDPDVIPEPIPSDIHDLMDNMPVAPSKKGNIETSLNDGQRATTDEPQGEEEVSSSTSEENV